MLEKTLYNEIVSDYFTPNVKAEVILDCILSSKIDFIVNKQCNLNTFYVTKEMSIPMDNRSKKYGNMGVKIDYVLADNTFVYLVELKTTESSKSAPQLSAYENICAKDTFGNTLAKRLIDILTSKTGFNIKNFKIYENDEVFLRLYNEICSSLDVNIPETFYTKHAFKLIKNMKCSRKSGQRSRKYILTLANIIDYLNINKEYLWNKEMRIIYITPCGEECGNLYINGANNIGPNLVGAIEYLENESDQYSKWLANILHGIYVAD